MLEIVFSDSACGSLKMAQHYGQGVYPGGCIGVIISRSDGRKPSKREKRAAQREAEEAERLAWESGAPMGGNTADVYGFGLMLSIGDISEDAPGMRRRQALEQLYGVFPRGTGQIAAQELLLRANSDWSEVQKRAAAGEAIRIWYSNQPDELCGFYWGDRPWRMVSLSGFAKACAPPHSAKAVQTTGEFSRKRMHPCAPC